MTNTATEPLSDRDLFMVELVLSMTAIGGSPMKLPTTLGQYALVRRTGSNAWIFGTHANGKIVWELPPLTSVHAILARLECEKTGRPYEPIIETEHLAFELLAA